MIPRTTLLLLGLTFDSLSSDPEKESKEMVKSLKLGINLTNKVTTRILLQRLAKLKLGTDEIENVAKLMTVKGGNCERNKKKCT